jgi:hypothetical protein
VLARKQVLRRDVPGSNIYGYADPPQYAISNAVEFEVIAATNAWANQAIANSVAILNGPQASSLDDYLQRRFAAEQLRFLDVPAAWSASLAVLPFDESTLLRGLRATRDPERVCKLMLAAVPAPSQVVSSNYLGAMASTCARASLHDPPPFKPVKSGEPSPEPSAEQREYWRREREAVQDVLGRANSSLAASLP